ncbi:hypothetical protein GQ457_01G021470 [Hibiscus cannabinus]
MVVSGRLGYVTRLEARARCLGCHLDPITKVTKVSYQYLIQNFQDKLMNWSFKTLSLEDFWRDYRLIDTGPLITFITANKMLKKGRKNAVSLQLPRRDSKRYSLVDSTLHPAQLEWG